MCYPSQEPSRWLVGNPAPLSALQQQLVASMALGMNIERQVLSWWPFGSHLSIFHLPGVLGMLSLCLVCDRISEQQMLNYVQGMLETYISGAHIQVDPWQSHACNTYDSGIQWSLWLWNLIEVQVTGVLAPTCMHVNLYPKGFVCIDVLYGITGIAANPVIDQTFSTEGSGSCT